MSLFLLEEVIPPKTKGSCKITSLVFFKMKVCYPDYFFSTNFLIFLPADVIIEQKYIPDERLIPLML